MFEKLSEVGNLTSRDIDLLLLSSRDLTNQTNSVSDHYHARKECFDNLFHLREQGLSGPDKLGR